MLVFGCSKRSCRQVIGLHPRPRSLCLQPPDAYKLACVRPCCRSRNLRLALPPASDGSFLRHPSTGFLQSFPHCLPNLQRSKHPAVIFVVVIEPPWPSFIHAQGHNTIVSSSFFASRFEKSGTLHVLPRFLALPSCPFALIPAVVAAFTSRKSSTWLTLLAPLSKRSTKKNRFSKKATAS